MDVAIVFERRGQLCESGRQPRKERTGNIVTLVDTRTLVVGSEPDCLDAERLEVGKLGDEAAKVSETVAIVVFE